ncbi:hypothetical protein [Roseimarinus sediminis]|uniref:hypothetical protein n=1 Tax=Roseimarinus sediminis TaxID=1610899 RepID=UPI003D1F2ACC
MKTLLKIISLIGLILTIVPSILVLNGIVELKTHFNLMLVGMILWFSTAIFWMKSPSLDDQPDEK